MSSTFSLELSFSQTEWKEVVSDEQSREKYFGASIFVANCEFGLVFYPRKKHKQATYGIISLQCHSFPENVHALNLDRTFLSNNLKHRFKASLMYDRKNDSWGWSYDISTAHLKSVNEETFSCRFRVEAIYSLDNPKVEVLKNEWHNYIGHAQKNTISNSNLKSNSNSSNNNNNASNDENKQNSQELEIAVLNLTKKVELLDSQVHSLTKDMQLMKNNQNNNQGNEVKSPLQMFEDWLTAINMHEYFDLFVESGFDELDLVCELTDQELRDDIGIHKKGHRMKLVKGFTKHVQTQQPQPQQKVKDNNNNIAVGTYEGY